MEGEDRWLGGEVGGWVMNCVDLFDALMKCLLYGGLLKLGIAGEGKGVFLVVDVMRGSVIKFLFGCVPPNFFVMLTLACSVFARLCR